MVPFRELHIEQAPDGFSDAGCAFGALKLPFDAVLPFSSIDEGFGVVAGRGDSGTQLRDCGTEPMVPVMTQVQVVVGLGVGTSRTSSAPGFPASIPRVTVMLGKLSQTQSHCQGKFWG
jgi:hypothetical protein